MHLSLRPFVVSRYNMERKQIMTQQSFSVGQSPRVVIRSMQGNLTVRPWKDMSIHVRVVEDAPIAAQIYQEGDTVFINGAERDIELTVPYIKKGFLGTATISTDISVTDASGTITMEDVGNVELMNVGRDVDLTRVEKSLRASNVATVRERKGVGGDAVLTSVGHADIGAVGGSVNVQQCGVLMMGAVGGSLKGERIGELLRCGAIGGSCTVLDSMSAEIAVSNVGGSLTLQGVARMPSCTVGGSATIATDMPFGSSMRLIVGGSATITLPERPNVRMHIMAGGSIRGDALDRKYGNMANIVLGDGSASLNLTAGGNVTLQKGSFGTMNGTHEPEVPHQQKRQAILQMVAEGRISVEEGNTLLDALGE